MFERGAIQGGYSYIATVLHPWLAFLHHIGFGVALGLVFSGNRKPGYRLMTLVLASMAFSVIYGAQNRGLTFVSVGFFVLLVCLLHEAWRPQTDWRIHRSRPRWMRRLGIFALVWAWCYPAYFKPLWMLPVAAPLGVLPGPTLLALLALLMLAFPQTNRLLHWAAVIAAVLYGGLGVVWLWNWVDLPLLVIAGISLRELIHSVRESGGIFEDDLPPSEKPKPVPEGAKTERVWKL